MCEHANVKNYASRGDGLTDKWGSYRGKKLKNKQGQFSSRRLKPYLVFRIADGKWGRCRGEEEVLLA
jgi:hypothetical protein